MEKNLLKTIADNPQLLEVLKETLISKFSIDAVSPEQSDEEIGQVVRARLVGVYKINEAFKEIETYKTIKSEVEEDMPAR